MGQGCLRGRHGLGPVAVSRPVWLGEDKHVWDHVRVHNQLIEDDRLTTHDMAVWLAVAYHANIRSGGARPEQRTLGELAKCSDREVRRSIVRLKSWGYIEVEIRPGKPSVYSLLSPPPRTHSPTSAADPGLTVLPPRTHSPTTPDSQSYPIPYMNKNQEQEPRTRENLSLVQADESAQHQPSAEGREPGTKPWPDNLSEIPAELDRIQAPPGFYDPDFWARIDEWLAPHPTVGYMDELRRWVTWWYTMPPVKRRKAVQRSFTTWLRTEEAKANNAAERIRANGQKQARR